MNHSLIHEGKASMALLGSWNVKAFCPGFSEIPKWTWRAVSEEITTKDLPMCGGGLHWGTAGPSAIPEWALRQVSRHSLVKRAASLWLWRLEMFTADPSRSRCGRSPRLFLERITWPESRMSSLRFGPDLFKSQGFPGVVVAGFTVEFYSWFSRAQ